MKYDMKWARCEKAGNYGLSTVANSSWGASYSVRAVRIIRTAIFSNIFRTGGEIPSPRIPEETSQRHSDEHLGIYDLGKSKNRFPKFSKYAREMPD